MSNPLVSIIIPTFNRAEYLPETLDSIVAQTYTNWECIIVDDGSTDSTKKTLLNYTEKDKRFICKTRPKNKPKGANACRNYGFEISKGDYIQFFDSDDIMLSMHIEEKVKALEQKKNIDFVTCNHVTFYKKNKEYHYHDTRINTFTGNLYEDYILGAASILTMSPLWNRAVIKNSPLFDENLHQLQDLDLYSKILFKNQNYKYLEEELIQVRVHNNSISTDGEILNYKVDSVLTVKERIIDRTPDNLKIIQSVIIMILSVMRYQMAGRDYIGSDKCLKFVKKYKSRLTLKHKLSIFRIEVFYKLFKILKKGDTKFKNLLKL